MSYNGTEKLATSLTPEQRQTIDSMKGAAEALRDNLDLFVQTTELVITCEAPTEQLLNLAKRIACRLVGVATAASNVSQAAWGALTAPQAPAPADQPDEKPAAGEEEQLDVSDIPQPLLQRRGHS